MAAFRESAKRSLIKATVFRVLVVVSDIVVIYLITHRYDVTIGVTIATNVASMILYYLHERVWNKISYGRKSTKR